MFLPRRANVSNIRKSRPVSGLGCQVNVLDRLRVGWINGFGRVAARAEDAQGTPTQSHISPSILSYEDKTSQGVPSWLETLIQSNCLRTPAHVVNFYLVRYLVLQPPAHRPLTPESSPRVCPNYLCRANMAHIRESRPGSGLGFQANVITTSQGVPSSLETGIQSNCLCPPAHVVNFYLVRQLMPNPSCVRHPKRCV